MKQPPDDPRYTTRLKLGSLGPDSPILVDPFEHDAEVCGTWDTVEKRFVKWNPIERAWEPEPL